MRRAFLVGGAALAVALVFLSLRAIGARRAAPSPPSASPLAVEASSSTVARGGGAAAAGRTRGAIASPTPTASAGTVVIRGGYGTAPTEFGRRRDPESNPEAPMAVAAGAGGQLAIVDQVNRRISRYKDGKLVGTVSIGGDTVQDIAFARDGKMLVLDRLVDGNVQVYGADGKLANEVSLAGKGVPEAGGITGLFSDDDGIYVERDHDSVVRIADASGKSDPNRPELPGRPSRDGHLLLSAQIADPANGDVLVSATDRSSGQPAWQQPIHLGIPIIHIITLDSDAGGFVYLAVDVGHETTSAPFRIVDERILVARLGSGGAPRGMLSLPPLPTADESFRPITVDDDGSVYVMTAGDNGLAVTRYVFP